MTYSSLDRPVPGPKSVFPISSLTYRNHNPSLFLMPVCEEVGIQLWIVDKPCKCVNVRFGRVCANLN